MAVLEYCLGVAVARGRWLRHLSSAWFILCRVCCRLLHTFSYNVDHHDMCTSWDMCTISVTCLTRGITTIQSLSSNSASPSLSSPTSYGDGLHRVCFLTDS